MDERKGIDRLVRAFAAARLRDDDRLLLAGRLSESLRRLIQADFADLISRDRLVLMDRYLTDDELCASVTAMDLICTPYPRHVGSASIVIRAAATGRPTLGVDYGWIGFVIPRFQLGWTCAVDAIPDLAMALARALDQAAGFRLSAAGRRFVDFIRSRIFRRHGRPSCGGGWACRRSTRRSRGARSSPLDPLAPDRRKHYSV